jgi:predicted lysophospholipase L1 biosynthesis ABC-type transport system permease subunit
MLGVIVALAVGAIVAAMLMNASRIVPTYPVAAVAAAILIALIGWLWAASNIRHDSMVWALANHRDYGSYGEWPPYINAHYLEAAFILLVIGGLIAVIWKDAILPAIRIGGYWLLIVGGLLAAAYGFYWYISDPVRNNTAANVIDLLVVGGLVYAAFKGLPRFGGGDHH